jgi:hypothetical protein
MDMANLKLPEITNGDIEVGIASGVDDIDEPYSILRICNLVAHSAGDTLALIQAIVNIKKTSGTPNQSDVDAIKRLMNFADDTQVTTLVAKSTADIVKDIKGRHPAAAVDPDPRATLAVNPCPVNGSKENQVWNSVICIIVSKGWSPSGR